MVEQLSNDHQRTYDAIFQHPITSNLERRDVRSLFEALGTVTDEHNGNLKFERNGQSLILHPPHSNHPAGFEEVTQIRHFLRSSEVSDKSANSGPLHLLVVIEHRQAMVFRSELADSVPEKIVPHSTHRNPRHVHNAQEHGGRQSRPAGPSFYKAIAENLEGADEILMFGTGEGGRKSMDTLLTELRDNYNDLYLKVVGSHEVGGKHLEDDDLLERAREFYRVRSDHQKSALSEPATVA